MFKYPSDILSEAHKHETEQEIIIFLISMALLDQLSQVKVPTVSLLILLSDLGGETNLLCDLMLHCMCVAWPYVSISIHLKDGMENIHSSHNASVVLSLEAKIYTPALRQAVKRVNRTSLADTCVVVPVSHPFSGMETRLVREGESSLLRRLSCSKRKFGAIFRLSQKDRTLCSNLCIHTFLSYSFKYCVLQCSKIILTGGNKTTSYIISCYLMAVLSVVGCGRGGERLSIPNIGGKSLLI